jgi:hypothetical protein
MSEAAEFTAARMRVANAKLTAYRAECWRLAILSQQGIVDRIRAVDLLWEIAVGHAIIRAQGADRVEAIIAEAFADTTDDFDLLYAEDAAE